MDSTIKSKDVNPDIKHVAWPPPDGDMVLDFLATAEKIDFTQKEANQVKRKLDIYLLPIVSLEVLSTMVNQLICFSYA